MLLISLTYDHCQKTVYSYIGKVCFRGRIVRRIFGLMRDQGGLGQWQDEISRMCGMYEKRSAFRGLVANPEGKKSFWRPRRRWEDNIKRGFKCVELKDANWAYLAQVMDYLLTLVSNGTDFGVLNASTLTSWTNVICQVGLYPLKLVR